MTAVQKIINTYSLKLMCSKFQLYIDLPGDHLLTASSTCFQLLQSIDVSLWRYSDAICTFSLGTVNCCQLFFSCKQTVDFGRSCRSCLVLKTERTKIPFIVDTFQSFNQVYSGIQNWTSTGSLTSKKSLRSLAILERRATTTGLPRVHFASVKMTFVMS